MYIHTYIYIYVCVSDVIVCMYVCVNLARTYGLDVTLLARNVMDVYPLAFASQVPAEG